MGFYKRYILPRILDLTMRKVPMEKHRPAVVSRAKGTVLEIGYGSGLNLPYFGKISKLYALDPSKEAYELSKKRMAAAPFPIEYIQASAEAIPLPDASVDSVLSTWNLCTVSRPDIALKEMARVLKPDGEFIFIEHGKSESKAAARVQRTINPLWKRIAGGCHWDRDIDSLIRNAGFEVKEMERFADGSMPLLFMYKGIAAKKSSETLGSKQKHSQRSTLATT